MRYDIQFIPHGAIELAGGCLTNQKKMTHLKEPAIF